jgi:glycosyltransferase involved in cell wall biosynthesis
MKVLFYGALGQKGKFIVGGGESGNNKTIVLLEKFGCEVVIIKKPYPTSKSILGLIAYAISLIIIILKFGIKLVRTPDVKTCHISGFYLHLVYQELMMIYIAKIFKKKVVYELRGGGLIEAYNARSKFYRLVFREAIRRADHVLCQGERYVNFIHERTQILADYYPNFVLSEFVLENENDRLTDEIVHLVYYGRIVESKNIEFILHVCDILKKKLPKFDLELIGSVDEIYRAKLVEQIKLMELEDCVFLKNPVTSISMIRTIISHKHFFIFPSKEMREGQSNALTESMALGVVPICSNSGFNKDVVGMQNLIINEFNPQEYSELIVGIWREGWVEYSRNMIKKVQDNFTEKNALKTLQRIYN